MISTTRELLVTLSPPGLVREREVLTCMWLLTSLHVSPISLISGLESCDLWPLGCLTAPVPQADVSPRCHVSSTPLFTVTVVSGCLAPQSPWLLPREGVREVGEATCHCPTAMERVEGLGLSMTAGNTTHGAAKDHSNRGREKEKARWNDCTIATSDNVGSFEVKNCAYGDSKVTQDQFSFC